MASFGARLKQEREQRGITLDDISLTTKIGTRMLRALEEEHFDLLPGGIFNKGFVRSYARAVGMDEEQAITDYLTATGTAPQGKQVEEDASPVGEIRAQMESRQEEPGSVPWGKFAAALLIVALGFAAWSYYSRESHSVSDATVNTPLPAANRETSAPESKPVAAEIATTNPQITQPAVSTTGHQSLSSSAPGPKTPPETNPSPASNPAQAATGRVFRVLIRARQDSWVSITVDGEVTTRHTLTAPAQRVVTAQDEVVIRAGNVGALDFEFNGHNLPQQGNLGEAKTLTFDKNGLHPVSPSQALEPNPGPLQP